MPAHWTYTNCEPAAELEQGDILLPTERLRAIFADVHPHFQDDKYLGFLLATQSCDLVRRPSVPKASYINLAVIRPLSQVIHKVLSHVATPVSDGMFKASDRAEARRLLERLLNQNEQSLGLFFLQSDAEAGIAEPAVSPFCGSRSRCEQSTTRPCGKPEPVESLRSSEPSLGG